MLNRSASLAALSVFLMPYTSQAHAMPNSDIEVDACSYFVDGKTYSIQEAERALQRAFLYPSLRRNSYAQALNGVKSKDGKVYLHARWLDDLNIEPDEAACQFNARATLAFPSSERNALYLHPSEIEVHPNTVMYQEALESIRATKDAIDSQVSEIDSVFGAESPAFSYKDCNRQTQEAEKERTVLERLNPFSDKDKRIEEDGEQIFSGGIHCIGQSLDENLWKPLFSDAANALIPEVAPEVVELRQSLRRLSANIEGYSARMEAAEPMVDEALIALDEWLEMQRATYPRRSIDITVPETVVQDAIRDYAPKEEKRRGFWPSPQ